MLIGFTEVINSVAYAELACFFYSRDWSGFFHFILKPKVGAQGHRDKPLKFLCVFCFLYRVRNSSWGWVSPQTQTQPLPCQNAASSSLALLPVTFLMHLRLISDRLLNHTHFMSLAGGVEWGRPNQKKNAMNWNAIGGVKPYPDFLNLDASKWHNLKSYCAFKVWDIIANLWGDRDERCACVLTVASPAIFLWESYSPRSLGDGSLPVRSRLWTQILRKAEATRL